MNMENEKETRNELQKEHTTLKSRKLKRKSEVSFDSWSSVS